MSCLLVLSSLLLCVYGYTSSGTETIPVAGYVTLMSRTGPFELSYTDQTLDGTEK